MKILTQNTTGMFGRWTRLFAAMLALALMVPAAAVSQSTAVNLGTAGDFRILAKTGISTTGTTQITGDIGLSPAAASFITGFALVMGADSTYSTSALVTGKVYAADYKPPTPTKMTTAVSDMETAYTDAAGRTSPDHTELGAGNITSMTLAPGLYKWSTGVTIAAAGVTISGSASDIWIFQIAQDLTVANGAIVTLSGGALASNIFWQVAGLASIGTTAAMEGIILCQTGIVLNTGATLTGKALAQSDVTMDANTVLPVELVAFTATANRMNANLHWSTATEANNYGFEVERRQTAQWQKVGFVAGAGTSSSPRDYSYTDKNLAPGRYEYRIKQVDKDGTFSYHGSAEVEIGLAAKKFELESNYPNPFNPSTTIQFVLADDGLTSLKVYNMLGQKVVTLFDGNAQAGRVYQVKFDASTLPSGLYVAKLESGKQQMMRKMVLMK